jgi:SAM-dependent methyltransferase
VGDEHIRTVGGLGEGLVAGNHFDKYGSRNPVHRLLVGNFVRAARGLVRRAAPRTVLDVGCASGELGGLLLGAGFLHQGGSYVGVDVSPEQVALARTRHPERTFVEAAADRLPFPDGAFDLVIACEILEHVRRPAEVLAELRRVCTGWVLVSVPWEPWWRVLNCLRGKYWGELGNTPGHLQHFSRRGIRKLFASWFEIVAERRPFPWSMLLGRAL